MKQHIALGKSSFVLHTQNSVHCKSLRHLKNHIRENSTLQKMQDKPNPSRKKPFDEFNKNTKGLSLRSLKSIIRSNFELQKKQLLNMKSQMQKPKGKRFIGNATPFTNQDQRRKKKTFNF
jgi:hypothetical protein